MKYEGFIDRHGDYLLGAATFVAANLLDYALTVNGIERTGLPEGGVVMRQYIDTFGLYKGLLVGKTLLCGSVLAGMKVLDSLERRALTALRPKPYLYAGAGLVGAGGLSWLLV